LLVYLPLVASGALPAPADGTTPLAYAALGYLTWSLLCDAVLAPTKGLSRHRADVHAPLAAVLAGLLEMTERALCRTVVLIPLAVLTVPGGLDPLGMLAALGGLIPAVSLAVAVGVLVAFWAVPWPDVLPAVATALRLSLLPSLVLFPLPDGPGAWAAILLNPLAVWTEVLRAVSLGHDPGAVLWGAGVAWSLIGLALLAIGAAAFLRLAPRLREMAA